MSSETSFKKETYERVKESFKLITKNDSAWLCKHTGDKTLGFWSYYGADNQLVFVSGWTYTDSLTNYGKTSVFLSVPYEKAITFTEKDYDDYVSMAIYELKKIKIQNRMDDLQKDFENDP